jgi:ribosomal protein L16 Arg81 hydroxylase
MNTRRQASFSTSVYAWLLNPLTTSEFEAKYYQRDACVVHRGDPTYYDGLLGVHDLDQVLATHYLSHPEIILVSSDRDIAQSEYCDPGGTVDPTSVAQLFGKGATIIFNRLDRRVPALGSFSSDLLRTFSSPIQTNVYFTPATAQGFPSHWDTHDVFVLQIAGTKRWTTYESPFLLPLRGQDFDHERHATDKVKAEFDLHPGDMAYLPRGLIHAAKSQGEASLHITTGILAFTWADFLLQGVTTAALEHSSLREYLPLGFADASEPTADFNRQYGERLATLIDHMKSNPPFDSMIGEVAKQQKFHSQESLQQVLGLDTVSLSSRIRRIGAIWHLGVHDETCIVSNGQREVRLPHFLRPALEFLSGTSSCTVASIPDCVDDDGKLVLVKRLSREGFLEYTA